VWQAIQSKCTNHPTWSQAHVTQELHVSEGLVNKVLQQAKMGKLQPQKHSTGSQQIFPEENILLMIELLSVNRKGGSYTLKDVQHIFADKLGQKWAMLTLTSHLGQEYSWQKAVFEDPHKWLPLNCWLIEDFLIWHHKTPVKKHYQVKIFNKAQVDQTNLGNLVVWSQQGQQPLQEHYHHDIVVESWTITILTVLDHSCPLIYAITSDASNGDKFIDFLLDCTPQIFSGDVIFSNNCSFHQRSWSSDIALALVAAQGAEYKLLPKYCPEWSPAEQVFSFLKAHLQSGFGAQDDLLTTITEILNKVTIPMMIGWYKSCGWLV
jgi:hypothetical protein